ncbi:AI-2E family transporter [Paenibacillus sp. LMG 31459]|uniref:AI-2E family transporter n=1 Tax=Paenibacillus phytohabitans TaxID=2654978 RepID=A0ABX1YG75_9BACL|nr:AI-2E family transporter [Paenibacillus sp. FSL H8-0259]NOU78893.1 AI-2E family transporter [Paenibacillus phytohabitans]OMF25519.1 AI-2E family transporter [Paenibacillus sp. FSL H8-0259]
MLQSKYFRTCLAIIAFLTILYLGSKVIFLFTPLVSIFNLLLVPMMLSGFMYYLLRPLVNFLETKKLGRALSILLIYLVFIGLFVLFWVLVWPTLREQIQNFIDNTPYLVEGLQNQFNKIQNDPSFSRFFKGDTDLTTRLTEYVNSAITWVTNSMSNLIGVISSIVVVIATLPIILYYMLKDGYKLSPILQGLIPRKYRKEGQDMLKDIDSALSGFIVTRVLLNVVLGIMLYIGFLFIGLPYSLLLAVISIPLNFIPYVGSLLAAIPVIIVGFIESPSMALWSLIIIVVAQQIQDNVLSPIIYGKSLDVHPLTTVVLVLIGGDFFGIIGVLIALPVYMILKILFLRIYEIIIAEREDDPGGPGPIAPAGIEVEIVKEEQL